MSSAQALVPDAIIDAMAPALGLEIQPELRPAIITNLKLCFAFAALLDGFPLGDHEEPAAVFTP